MINFIYGSPQKEIELPNQPDAMLIKEFESICNLINDQSKGELERFLSVFGILGIEDGIIDQMSKDQFIENAKTLKKAKYNDELPPKVIELGGRTYVANIVDIDGTQDLVISARDVVTIERTARQNTGMFPSMVTAILYKDSQLTKNEHYSDAHIKHKAQLFRKELPASYAIPLLVRQARETVKDLANVEMAGDND